MSGAGSGVLELISGYLGGGPFISISLLLLDCEECGKQKVLLLVTNPQELSLTIWLHGSQI